MNAAIIVAAGSGTRFGGDVPKQFLTVDGKPLLIHTLEKFENCPAIDKIIVVLSEQEIEQFQSVLDNCSLQKVTKLITGGNSRAGSVLNGINALNAQKIKIVVIHDGARPLVTSREIAATVAKAQETGAACLVGKVTDTIKQVADGKIIGTVDRESLRRALTPQTFRLDVLQTAFAPENFDANATDECFLVEKAGFEIAFVEGSAKNIKITTREDFEFAEITLRQS